MNLVVLSHFCWRLRSHPARHMPQEAQTGDAAATNEIAASNDIVVTAQRREERLQDVPIAIAAFSGERLAHNGGYLGRRYRQPHFRRANFDARGAGQPSWVIRGVVCQISIRTTRPRLRFIMTMCI